MILKAYPPNYSRIKNVFTLRKGVIFTFGKNIYNPDNVKIDDSFLIHERVHMRQQGDKPGLWWDKYLIEAGFRLGQELEAYRTQFNFFRIKHPKKAIDAFLDRIAEDLASGIYGNMISVEEAKQLINK